MYIAREKCKSSFKKIKELNYEPRILCLSKLFLPVSRHRKKNFTCKEAANTIFLEDYRSGWTLLKHEKILGK